MTQLVALERAPQTRLRTEQTALQRRNTAYSQLQQQLTALKTRVDALAEASLYASRSTSLSNYGVASATAASGTPAGTYAFSFTQLATAAAQQGGTNAGAGLQATNDVSGLVLSSAPFSPALTAGTFTVNNQTITVATTDTLGAVFDRINTATSGAVTASYNAATDKISLSGTGPIVLGSAGDTSNFLQAARLYHNGTAAVSSSAALGAVKTGATLATANFGTAVSDGGSGAGAFKVNGVTINFSATTDTVATVLQQITDSAAGVTAQYDPTTDQFTLTNKRTGDLGVALQDVTGNFLAATKLASAAGGTLAAGQDLLYTVNGGAELRSHSNTVDVDSHGITGLSVTALAGGSAVTTGSAGTTGFPMVVGSFGGTSTSATRFRTTPPHNFQTGYAVRFNSAGTLPSPITDATTYYVRRIDANNLSLHPTVTDAVNNTNAVNFGNNPPYTGPAYVFQVNPLAAGATTTTTAAAVTVTVGNDTATIQTALADFLTEYNKTQSLIDTQTAITIGTDGKITSGILSRENDATAIASQLRRLVFSQVSGLSGTLTQLAALGYDTTGNDNQLTLTDSEKLDAALANNLSSVQELFAHSSTGLAHRLSSYLDGLAGEEGSLAVRQTKLTKQSSDIDLQVANLERLVLMKQTQLTASFQAMELAQSRINQQLTFLTQKLGLATSDSDS